MSNMEMSISLPLGSFVVEKTKASRPITSLVSPMANPFQKLLLKNFAQYTKKDGHNKKGLVVQVSQEYGPHELRNLSRKQRINLSGALINIVKKIKYSEDYLNPIDLSPMAMKCNDNLDLLSLVDYTEFDGSSLVNDALEYLPGILNQLIEKYRYDYVIIDLPPFFSADVHHAIEISGHLLLPYLLNTTNMMRGIFGINRLFMRLRVAGFPIHIGAFVPFFTSKESVRYQKYEQAQIESIFGTERMGTSIPLDTKSKSFQIACNKNFIDFFEMNNYGHYGLSEKTRCEARKLFNMVDGGGYGHVDGQFVTDLGRISAKSKLVEILRHTHGLSESQAVVIRQSLQETMAEKLVYGLTHRSSVTGGRILQILEMQKLSERNRILETLTSSTQLSAQQMAVAAGLKNANDVYNRLPEFSLVKHWNLAQCEKKIGVTRRMKISQSTKRRLSNSRRIDKSATVVYT